MTHQPRRFHVVTLAFVLAISAVGSGHAQLTEEDKAVRRAMTKITAAKPEPTNVRVEVLLTDKADGKTVAEERLTFLLADWEQGSLRRNLPGNEPAWSRNFEVDARPTIQGNRIKLALRVNYQAPRDPAPSPDKKLIPEMLEFVQSVTSLVEPGKPTIMMDAYGDPANRRVSVQATATILK